jgi:hypothetical protein
VPFRQPPFQEAINPRDLAARMRTNPKAAVPFLENGEIAKWFATNGWAFPVPGAPARGIAAVQQFFEYMGLSKPPSLTLSESVRHFDCQPKSTVSGSLTIRTAARKWVYADVTSDAPWLSVTTPGVSGPQQATISYEIASDLLPPGDKREAVLHVTGNTGQKLTARVTATLGRPRKGAKKSRRSSSPVVLGAMAGLSYRLALAIPADFWARGSGDGLAHWLRPALSEDRFLHSFILATWWVGALAGVAVAKRQGGKLVDLFCGALTGAFSGLVGAATAGCLVGLLDAVPRAILARLATPQVQPVVAELLWIALASSCWAVGGAVIGGILGLFGTTGRRFLAFLAAPVAWLAGDISEG